jgi:thioesterase DpgC
VKALARLSGSMEPDGRLLAEAPQLDPPQRRALRDAFLRVHAEVVYESLTDGYRLALPVERLAGLAAQRFPGLAPSAAEMEPEAGLEQAAKTGLEIDQGILFGHLFGRPRPGLHLAHAALRPLPESLERLEEFTLTGRADLGLAAVERRGGVGQVELRNLGYLNAEDLAATRALEICVDLVLLDPGCEVGVLRGGVVDHPRYAGRRVFNAGLNLTQLYAGQIPLVGFFIARELGLVNKLYRGLWRSDDWESGLEETEEKPWIAAVESFAIGGGCQILLVMDRVLGDRGAYFNLPARKEGIIPGAANLRLPAFLGDRGARQAIMFERAFPVGETGTELLCDEVVEPGEMDSAIGRSAAQLTSSGLVSAAANRKALRAGQEPLERFCRYMAVYSREQALCLHSPALIYNLERYWRQRQQHRSPS